MMRCALNLCRLLARQSALRGVAQGEVPPDPSWTLGQGEQEDRNVARELYVFSTPLGFCGPSRPSPLYSPANLRGTQSDVALGGLPGKGRASRTLLMSAFRGVRVRRASTCEWLVFCVINSHRGSYSCLSGESLGRNSGTGHFDMVCTE